MRDSKGRFVKATSVEEVQVDVERPAKGLDRRKAEWLAERATGNGRAYSPVAGAGTRKVGKLVYRKLEVTPVPATVWEKLTSLVGLYEPDEETRQVWLATDGKGGFVELEEAK